MSNKFPCDADIAQYGDHTSRMTSMEGMVGGQEEWVEDY